MSATEPIPSSELESEWTYLWMNLYPRHTGLPMTIWVGPRAGARHDARVKVSMQHGDRMDVSNLAVVSVRPTPRLLEGKLSSDDLEQVRRWIEQNQAAIIEHWEGRTDGIELGRALKPL